MLIRGDSGLILDQVMKDSVRNDKILDHVQKMNVMDKTRLHLRKPGLETKTVYNSKRKLKKHYFCCSIISNEKNFVHIGVFRTA